MANISRKSLRTLVNAAILSSTLASTGVLAEEKLAGIKIPLRDGKFLMADISIPQAKGKFPAIFIHTPYKRENASSPIPDSPFLGELLDREHYAYVVTDWRGFFGSKEARVMRPNQGQDGYDIIDWIIQQSWSNGKVGMWGHSAVGVVEYPIIEEHHPGLVCAVPASAVVNSSYGQYYYGGVLQEHYARTLKAVGLAGWNAVLSHPLYDWFWKYVEHKNDPTKMDLPMFFITGWYDSHPITKLNTFNHIKTQGKKHAQDMKILIGPWHHTAFGLSKQGELEFPEAQGHTGKETMRFFDYCLRGNADNGWKERAPITYFQMGTNRWQTAATWPPPTEPYNMYLDVRNRLVAGRLPEGNASPDQFVYDPADPVSTIGGPSIVKLKGTKVEAGPTDLRQIERRSDVIVYTSDLLTEDLAMVGVPKLKLFVASDAADTDFAAWLTDVYPDGRSIVVTDGIWRLSLRNSLSRPDYANPGEINSLIIPLEVTAQTFIRGHKIRLLISSSNYPRFQPNQNVIARRFRRLRTKIATNKVYHSKEYPSHLVLPVAAH